MREDAGEGSSVRGAGQLARLAVIVLLWLLVAGYLLPVAARFAPRSLQKAISFQTFRAGAQILTLALGLLACFAALRAPRDALALRAPSRLALASTALLAPAVTVVSTLIAIRVALPKLMQELAERGAGASRKDAGAFGRELTEAPLLLTLISGALLAAVSEETLFRGALWSLMDGLLGPLSPGPAAEGEPPWETLPARLLRKARRGAATLLFGGGGATLVAAAIFGFMHRDLPGAVGIVRIVSTTCLGLASGVVRWRTRSILACVALHAAHNVLSLGNGRGWFRGALGSVEGVPVALLLLAAAGAALLLALRTLGWLGPRACSLRSPQAKGPAAGTD